MTHNPLKRKEIIKKEKEHRILLVFLPASMTFHTVLHVVLSLVSMSDTLTYYMC